MKKLLLLVLSLAMVVSLCACGGNNTDTPASDKNETELTLENYTTYLNINKSIFFTGKDWLMKPSGAPNSIRTNSKAECSVGVSGASSNYDYVNVVLTVKVSGTYDTFNASNGIVKEEDIPFNEELTITCNIAGEGSAKVSIFEGVEEVYQVIQDSIECEMEVISISGTVNRIG